MQRQLGGWQHAIAGEAAVLDHVLVDQRFLGAHQCGERGRKGFKGLAQQLAQRTLNPLCQVVAGTQNDALRTLQHQQAAMRLNAAGQMDQFTFAVGEVSLAERRRGQHQDAPPSPPVLPPRSGRLSR